MTTRAREFVDAWIEQNVKAEPFLADEDEETRPAEYASSCLADAEAAGVSRKEIDEEFDDLEEHMATEITRSAENRTSGLVRKDRF
jgi:hypothetical protein